MKVGMLLFNGAVLIICISAIIFILQIPPYQGRDVVKEGDLTFIEVSPAELEAIGMKVQHNSLVTDYGGKGFYLWDAAYTVYQTKLESMRPRKWWRWKRAVH